MPLTPEIILLLLGTAMGALAAGYGLAYLLRPQQPRPVDQAALAEIEVSAGDDRPARGVGSLPLHDFDGWKDKKLVEQLRQENTQLQNLFTLLPGLTKRITNTLRKRQLAPLLAEMVTRLCLPPPDRVLVLLATRAPDQLVVAALLGHQEGEVYEGLRVQGDCGLIGLVARRQVAADLKDLEHDPTDALRPVAASPFSVEVAAPMVHDRRLLGVLAIGGLPQTTRFTRRMLTVAANLGALALANAEFVGQIQRLADSDALTGLFNKRYFFERLERAVEAARRHHKPLSLFMFDIDHFKRYNDRNGHQAGDEALRMMGRLLRERLRQGFLAARYGGEEFIVILPGVERREAHIFAESIRAAVLETRFPHGDSQPLGAVSISGGVASFPDDATAGSALIECADANLYKAKKAGRNAIAA